MRVRNSFSEWVTRGDYLAEAGKSRVAIGPATRLTQPISKDSDDNFNRAALELWPTQASRKNCDGPKMSNLLDFDFWRLLFLHGASDCLFET
jgi:hypothetical protein